MLRRNVKAPSSAAMIVIGGVNTKAKDEDWELSGAGFCGEVYPVEWRTDFAADFTKRDLLRPDRLMKHAEAYLSVMSEAEKEGRQLARELLDHPIAEKKLFILAHSMGTRVVSSFFRELSKLAGTGRRRIQLEQVFLFNGAAPIHPKCAFRDWALSHTSKGVHNFFNPADPIISPLALLCSLISILPLELVDAFPGEFECGHFLAPPIGHFPSTMVGFNYNTVVLQGVNHSVGRLGKYLRYDQVREHFDIQLEPTTALPRTIGELVQDLRNAFTKDLSVTAKDYLKGLSLQESKHAEAMIAFAAGEENLIDSTFDLLRMFEAAKNRHDERLEAMSKLAAFLEQRPAPDSSSKPMQLLPAKAAMYLQ